MKITIDEQFVTNPQTGKVDYLRTVIYKHTDMMLTMLCEYGYASYCLRLEDNLLVANQPSDAEDNDEVFIMAGDGADIIEGMPAMMIEGGRGDDLIRIAATQVISQYLVIYLLVIVV